MPRMLLCRLVGLLWVITLVNCGSVSSGNQPLSPVQKVAAAKAALVVGYATGDSASSVTQNLTLPTAGLDGSSISWASSNATVVTNAGVVSQPQTGDATVTLTATISVGTTSDTKGFPLTVKAQMTEAQAVAAAKAALAIGYASGDSAASVTQDLTLTATGLDGSSIAWASNNTLLVSNAGVVSRPTTGDANATLTATITVGSASDTKAFPLTVRAQMTDVQAVAAAKAALAIGYAAGDSASCVTQDLTLPSAGLYGSSVVWSSNNITVVSNAGVVLRPATGDASATVTATITVGSASDTKAFPLTVKPQMTDAQAVAAAKAALAIGYKPGDAATSVTQDLTLPVTGVDGCTISWSSSDSAIANNGTVTRQTTGDLPVTLTATITLNAASDTKVFIVTVKAQMTDAEVVAAAKAALAIGYAEGDSATSVTQGVTLPVTGSSGCTISWASSNESLISTAGSVQRPSIGDAGVTLTATISSHSASDTAAFNLTVLGQMSDADAVTAAKAALNIVYASGDSAASVTQNVSLPAAGADSTTVTWTSDTPEVISIAGVVTRPQASPAIVTLTATISSHGTSDTRKFILTVQQLCSDADVVAADKAALTIGFGPGDSPSSVTGNIFLSTSGTGGSSITWSSSAPQIVSMSGGVTVPSDNNASVTMTAILSYGLASDTKDFSLTVKAMLLSDWVNTTSISPGNGAIEVDPGIVIRIPFQVALDPSTVNCGTFQIIQTSNSQDVPIIVTYDAPSQTVNLTPQAPLSQATQYSTVVGTSLRDSGENSLPTSMGFNFTTLSYANILSQWKFEGDGSDASGNGNTLTDIWGTFDGDVVHEGTASLYLDGSGQGGISNVNLGMQLTVAVWVNIDNPMQGSINTIMANGGSGEASDGFKLCINRWGTSDQSVVIEVGDGNTGGKWTTAPGLIQPGSWYHLAFVIDQPNQTMKIYYNGAESTLSFASDEGYTLQQFDYNFGTTGPFTVGAFPGNYYGLKGHLDDMRVYNRVLSADEIAKIAQEK